MKKMKLWIALPFIKIAEWILRPHFYIENTKIVDLDKRWEDWERERTNLIEKVVVYNQVIDGPEA